MHKLSRGQRIKLSDLGLVPGSFTIHVDIAASNPAVDCACFGLNVDRQLRDERYMTFFNQPASPCGGVRLADSRSFEFRMEAFPATIEAITLTLAIDGEGTLKQLGSCLATVVQNGQALAGFEFSGALFGGERAIMLVDLYQKDGQWRLSPVGQGFNGGLDALVQYFGGTIAQPAAKVSLEKRIQSEAPHLVSLVKKATVSLEKVGLSTHKARVCLCLDISGSMLSLYKSGAVQQFAERILALGCRFDDDGEIDVFLFGAKVHHAEPMTLSNSGAYVAAVCKKHPLEGDTRYGDAMAAIRRFYFDGVPTEGPYKVRRAETPVYVMFVTDGSTSDKAFTELQLRDSSREPIFWQYMGIGKGRKSKNKTLQAFSESNFPFLEKLDDLSGRLIDNAGFFSLERPDEHPDDTLFDLLMEEYPEWTKLAKGHHMFV